MTTSPVHSKRITTPVPVHGESSTQPPPGNPSTSQKLEGTGELHGRPKSGQATPGHSHRVRHPLPEKLGGSKNLSWLVVGFGLIAASA